MLIEVTLMTQTIHSFDLTRWLEVVNQLELDQLIHTTITQVGGRPSEHKKKLLDDYLRHIINSFEYFNLSNQDLRFNNQRELTYFNRRQKPYSILYEILEPLNNYSRVTDLTSPVQLIRRGHTLYLIMK